MKSTFRLGAFIENIEGTVVNPNNALGAPDGVFTGNTTGSWTAKWALEAPVEPSELIPYTIRSLKVHCRRADSAGGSTDPVLRSVTVRDSSGQPVYEFLSGAQLTRFAGPLALMDKTLSKDVQDHLLDITLPFASSMYSQVVNTNRRSAMVRGAVLCADNTLFILFGWSDINSLGRIFKISNFNTPQQSLVSWTPATNLSMNVQMTQGGESSWLRASECKTNVGLPGVSVFWSFSEKEISPGVTHLVRMAAPSGLATAVGGFAYSPDGEYVAITEDATSSKLLVVGKRNLVDENYTNISQSGLEVTASNNRSTDGVAWVGNTVARSLRTGYYAWTWDSSTEVLTPITGVQGGQWSSVTSLQGLTLSPDARWLVAVNNTTNTVWVEDLNNPGAGTRRTIAIPSSMVRLTRPVWVPNKQSVIFLADRNASWTTVFSQNNGYPVTLFVPESGGLAWECTTTFDYPFTAQNWLKQVSFSDTQGVAVRASYSNNSAVSFKSFAEVLRVFSLEESSLESRAVWELPCKQIGAPYVFGITDILGSGNWLDFDRTPTNSAGWDGRTGEVRHSYNNGGYVFLPAASSEHVFPLNRVNKFGRLPPLALKLPHNHSSTNYGVSVSKDGLWTALGHRIYSVVHNGGDSWTFTDVTSGGIDTGLTSPAFRHAPNGDPLPNLVAFFHGTATPKIRIYEVSTSLGDPPFVYRDDLSVPNALSQVNFNDAYGLHWSYDGQYLSQHSTNSGQPRVWRFTGTEFIELSLPTITYTSSMRLSLKWHPTSNVLLLRTNTSDGHLFYILQCSGNSITLINSTGFLAQIAAIKERHVYADWEANGKYFSVSFGLNPAVDSVNLWQRHLYAWDETRLINNEPLVELPKDMWGDTGGYLGQYLSGVMNIYNMVPRPRYDYLPPRMFAADSNIATGVMLFNADPTVDFTNLTYNSGWEVEVETWGDGNAVQLEGIELELDLLQFQLAAPTNLQVISATGSSALVEWEWSPE